MKECELTSIDCQEKALERQRQLLHVCLVPKVGSGNEQGDSSVSILNTEAHMTCLLPCASQESVAESEASSDSGPLYGERLSSEKASSLFFSVTSVLTAAGGASPTFRFAGIAIDSSIADSKTPLQCLYISYDIGSPKSEAKRRNCAPYRLGLDDVDGSPIMMCSGLPRCMTVDESMLRVEWGGLALIQFPELEALRSFTQALKDVVIEHKSLALAPRSPQPPPPPLPTANRVEHSNQ